MRELRVGSEEFATLAGEVLARGRTLRFRARGVSMCPFIRDGDVVEVEPIGDRPICRRDVVLRRGGDGRVLAHRVTRVTGRGEGALVHTRGDALGYPDGPISQRQVLGRVVNVAREGSRMSLRGGPRRLAVVFWAAVRRVGGRRGWIPRVLNRAAGEGSGARAGG